MTKLRRKQNAGLSPLQKLILQFLFATIFLLLRKLCLDASTVVSFFNLKIDLGYLYYPLMLLLIVGIINFANLTDGIDGLAACVAFSCGVTYFMLTKASTYDAAIIALAAIGGSLGFLCFNINPAKIFMGDTGSLYLGAMICACAFSFDKPVSLIPIGVIYIVEGLSVVLQVAVYKSTKKRLFKMAPLHHHLEKSGSDENKICIIAMLVTFLSSLLYVIFIL